MLLYLRISHATSSQLLIPIGGSLEVCTDFSLPVVEAVVVKEMLLLLLRE